MASKKWTKAAKEDKKAAFKSAEKDRPEKPMKISAKMRPRDKSPLYGKDD